LPDALPEQADIPSNARAKNMAAAKVTRVTRLCDCVTGSLLTSHGRRARACQRLDAAIDGTVPSWSRIAGPACWATACCLSDWLRHG